MPVRHIAAEETVLRDAVYIVQAAETELSVDESCVNILVDVLRIELLDQPPPAFPSYPVLLSWKQVLLLGNVEVALMRNQGSIREQEPERTSAKPSTVTFAGGGGGVGSLRAVTVLLTREIFGPKTWFKKKARDWFEKHPARCPHEVHIHLLRDEDISTEQELLVQRTGWHGPARDP